jgi:hypothetical protein
VIEREGDFSELVFQFIEATVEIWVASTAEFLDGSNKLGGGRAVKVRDMTHGLIPFRLRAAPKRRPVDL